MKAVTESIPPPHPRPLCTPLHPPQNTSQAWLLGELEGKRNLEERGASSTTTAVSKSQQPGEGLWVIFYEWSGTGDVHLFIFLVMFEVCDSLCSCDCLCVCVSVTVFIAHPPSTIGISYNIYHVILSNDIDPNGSFTVYIFYEFTSFQIFY